MFVIKRKSSLGMLGKRHSNASKKKMSDIAKQHPSKNLIKRHSEESKAKISRYRKDGVWISKDESLKFILKSNLIFWQDAGWRVRKKQ